jgi:hypothetical protein
MDNVQKYNIPNLRIYLQQEAHKVRIFVLFLKGWMLDCFSKRIIFQFNFVLSPYTPSQIRLQVLFIQINL